MLHCATTSLLLLLGAAPPTLGALPIRFSLVPDVVVLDSAWHCISLTLAPEEENPSFAIRVSPLVLPATLARAYPVECERCNGHHGVYVDVEKLSDFVERSLSSTAEFTSAGSCAPDDAPPAELSTLQAALAAYNGMLFSPMTRAARAYWAHFHERSAQDLRLAHEVTFYQPPASLNARITERLWKHSRLFFFEGSGDAVPSIGASQLGGKLSDGRVQPTGPGGKLVPGIAPVEQVAGPTDAMSALFPSDVGNDGGDSSGAEAVIDRKNIDTDVDARARATALGESYGGGSGTSGSSDMDIFEASLKEHIAARADVHALYGADAAAMDFQFQHRLWRFGPKMDSKKGGVWHTDTCPWGTGIDTQKPPGTIMFTHVFIIHLENVDFLTAGTRVRDPLGKVTQLPCEAGHGNLVRTDVVTHAGPLTLRAIDESKPAYRIMMQTKILVSAKGGQRSAPTPGPHWEAIGMRPLLLPPPPPEEATRPTDLLGSWLEEASATLSKASDGSELAWPAGPYPLNVSRAWQCVRDLCEHMGFFTGQLPSPERITTAVVTFGLTYETSPVLQTLEASGFRTMTVARSAQLARLQADEPDRFANIAIKLKSDDGTSAAKVAALLAGEPLDMHLLVDSLGSAPLHSFGDSLARAASKKAGTGRIVSVTYLSSSDERQLDAEQGWLKFGEQHDIRINILRVADRVYSHQAYYGGTDIGVIADKGAMGNLSVCRLSRQLDRISSCRDMACAPDAPITRIHLQDLTAMIIRLLELMDMYSREAPQLMHWNSSAVLDAVDDARADSMESAVYHCMVMHEEAVERPASSTREKLMLAPSEHHRNAELKRQLGIERLLYPTYRHTLAAAFISGNFDEAGLV